METLIAILIFALALGGLFGFVVWSWRTQNFVSQQSETVEEARRALNTMVKEMREATSGADGSFAIAKAEDYELVFFSDIDGDGEAERVRYFTNPAGGASGSQVKTCVSFAAGGSCGVSFQGFLTGTLASATLAVSAQGDLNSGNETVAVSAEAETLGTLCAGGACGECAGAYQNLTSFDVSAKAQDNALEVLADATDTVEPICSWEEPNHSLKARFELSWQEVPIAQEQGLLKKGTIEPTPFPFSYPLDQETVVLISEHVVNEARSLPVFTYYDEKDSLISDAADRLSQTRRIHVRVLINRDVNREPDDFILESDVRLRNL